MARRWWAFVPHVSAETHPAPNRFVSVPFFYSLIPAGIRAQRPGPYNGIGTAYLNTCGPQSLPDVVFPHPAEISAAKHGDYKLPCAQSASSYEFGYPF
jgi:hypothetical protein